HAHCFQPRRLLRLCHPARRGTRPRSPPRLGHGTVLSGLTIANVLGVPLGAWLGQATSWRVTFGVVAGIGLLTLLTQTLWLPKVAPAMHGTQGAWAGILRPPVLHALLVCCLC